jgi:hypothetical protein
MTSGLTKPGSMPEADTAMVARSVYNATAPLCATCKTLMLIWSQFLRTGFRKKTVFNHNLGSVFSWFRKLHVIYGRKRYVTPVISALIITKCGRFLGSTAGLLV